MNKPSDSIDSFHHEAGKGHIQRPTNHQRYGENYDAIFGKNKKEQQDASSQSNEKR